MVSFIIGKKTIPLLFAAAPLTLTLGFSNNNIIHSSGRSSSVFRTTTTTSSASVVVVRSTTTADIIDDDAAAQSPQLGVRDVVELSKSAYRDLAEGSCYIVDATPTISFQYTRPVVERESSTVDDKKKKLSFDTTEHNNNIYKSIQDTHDNTKPLLLYLPGLDGQGISAVQQFDDLSNTFEFWRMRIDPTNDRSSFTELITTVSNFIQDVAVKQNNRKVILVGESFGGLLAPSVAMRCEAIANRNGAHDSPIAGLVMVNPATSFYKTNWSTLAPILASLRHIEQVEEEEEDDGTLSRNNRVLLPTPYSVIGGIALSLTIPDKDQYKSIFDMVSRTSSDELQDVLTAMRDGFGILADNLPAKVIEHRVGQWCNVGCDVVNPRLHSLKVPTLFIGGDDDSMLPTKEEGARLVDIMPNCTSMSVKDAGHFILDNRFNLTEAIIEAPFDPFNKKGQNGEKKYDPILDWKAPSKDEIQEAVENRVKPLRDLLSPKFFSTDKNGKRMVGLGNIPTPDGPILFVANHQLIGLDLGLIISELLEQRNLAARGLAHPIVFQAGNGGFGNGPGPTGPTKRITKRNKEGLVDPPTGDFVRFGAVMVTPKNFYRLLATGQAGLLFPGGVREVFHGKGEDYELFWPESTDFVRIAAKFNTTIIPISAIGSADSANILLDANELLNLPFGLGDRLKNSSDSTISARFNQKNSDESFIPPLVVPSIPARHYFVFGKPFDTSTIEPKDKEACAEMYGDVKAELRRGLDDVLEARKHDPYKDFAKRMAVERLSGKQTPTFDIKELN